MILLIYGILKKGTNELIYKTEIELQSRKQTYGYQGARAGGISWDTGIDIYTLLCVKQITNKTYYIAQGTLLNTLSWPIWEKNLKKSGYMYMYLIHFAIYLKLTQHCKSTILQ